MKPIIYRVQDSDGRGPWKPGFSQHWVEWSEEKQKLLPYQEQWPIASLQIMRRPNEYMGCGCISLDQLRMWFTESEYRTLRRHGYKAVMMKVDRILMQSDIQSVFSRVSPLKFGAKKVRLY